MDYNEIIYNLKKKYLDKVYLKKNRAKLIKTGALSLILLAGIFVLVLGFEEEIIIEEESKKEIDVEGFLDENLIIVDVGGAVVNPMVIELPVDSRVEDAIIEAGGLREDADVSNINRAAVLSDGEKVYIPSTEKEEDAVVAGQAPPNVSHSPLVNINTADETMLQELDGVGPATARKIIEYREANGRFTSPESIMDVDGIGEKTFADLEDDITI